MQKSDDYVVNKRRDGNSEKNINTMRLFFQNMLETLPQPTTSQEVTNFLNALGLLILYTYPERGNDGLYYVGSIKVKKVSNYLSSIVSLRNAINHPEYRDKWALAVRMFVAYSNDEARFDGVPLNIKRYCIMLEKINFTTFIAYITGLFDSSVEASKYSIVFASIKVPRGRRHKFDAGLIAEARLLAPEAYRDLPEPEFCIAMKDVLLEMEKRNERSKN